MFYRAVVEDNYHPNKNGMVKVRIFGIHTENNENSNEFENISTEQLPWAEVMGSMEFGLITGIGLSSIPKKGQHVWVILKDNDINYPLVIGTYTGKPIESSEGVYEKGEGFVDPDGVYPFKDRLGEYDINRLTRVENLNETIHQKINNNLDIVGDGIAAQSEPSSLNDKTKYTKNTILETESGHVIELDDTPNNERIRVYHNSGSYIEIRPDGSFVQKSVGSEGDHFIHMSDVSQHVKGEVKKYMESNVNWVVDGNFTLDVKGDVTINGANIFLN